MESADESPLVVIVDDDESVRSALDGVLRSAGLKSRSFASAEEFLRFDRPSETACLITDIRMPGMSGIELQARLAEDDCPIPVIFITAYGDARLRLQATGVGAVGLLEKPFDNELLLENVRAALKAGKSPGEITPSGGGHGSS